MNFNPHHETLDLQTWKSLFDPHHNRPYYSVDGYKYYNKLEAIIAAKNIMKITKQSPYPILRWHVFDELFYYDFSIEPQESYRNLCIGRAKQLREKYEYIRLFYSGGPDSHTTLRAFHEANAHIDEIVIVRNTTIGTDAPSNIENTQLTIPSINKIKEWFPNTKINLLEFVLDTHLKYEGDNNILSRMVKTPISNPICRTMANAFDLDKTMLKTYNKRVCELSGEPKPSLIKKNNKWYAYLVDAQIDTSLLLPNLELFHLSPDFPQLYVKQCHMLRHQYDKLMIGKNDSYSMVFEKDQDRKNMFLERYNEWDKHNIIEAAHRIQKFTSNLGDAGTAIYTMRKFKNNLQFGDLLQWMRGWWRSEIFAQNSEYFHEKVGLFPQSVGMLSNFWCLDDNQNATVDQLFPHGFGVY